MLITFLYNFGLFFLALIALPKFLFMWIFHKKYRTSFAKRFGWGFPIIKKGERPLIWIHAVSVGETRAIVPLVKLIKNEKPDALILISSVTETGHAEALRSIQGADFHVFLPFDLLWIVKPIVRKIKPDLVLLCESDFWFNFLKAVKEENGKVVLINGKISERSTKRFSWVPFFAKSLFQLIDLFCLQNVVYKDRFKKFVPQEKMVVTGNMKFDDKYPQLSPEELAKWRTQLGIEPEDSLLVIGSSHDPEETLFIKNLHSLWKKYPRLKVILVPRHPERFNPVAYLLQKENIPFQRVSKPTGESTPVVLGDAMGILRKCYQIGDIAIVAGSYTEKVGGHNILEPCWYGVPVLFGPHMHSQPEMVDLVNEYGAGLQVKPEMLQSTLDDLLANLSKRKKLGSAGLKLVADIHGATQRTWEKIEKSR